MLAIGIVVDDAIVIVEGVARYVEEGMPGRQAAARAMDDLTGPVLGITLVLMSVFIPAAFLPGLTGQLYRQFALVIASTAFISAVNALTLKPTQSALWLRPPKPPERRNFFYRGFNTVYGALERGYTRLIGGMIHRSGLMVALALILVGVALWGLTRVPTAFLPTEDQGYVIVAAQLPDGASKERTDRVLEQIQGFASKVPGVEHVVTVSGISILDNRASLANAGVAFVVLKDWDVRLREPGQDVRTILERLNRGLQGVPQAFAFALPPPPIQGIGNVGGFSMQVELRNGNFDYALLQTLTNAVVANSNAQSSLQRVATTFRAGAPQIFVNVNRIKAETIGVTVGQLFAALSDYVGSNYVGQITKFGHVFQIYTQAEAKYRANVDDIRNLKVKAGDGTMTPIGTVVDIEEVQGPALISLYNLYPSSTIVGSPAPGFSSGQSLDIMEQIANNTLPNGTGFEWTAMSYQEKQLGNQTYYVFGFALLLVYFVLAGQYESSDSASGGDPVRAARSAWDSRRVDHARRHKRRRQPKRRRGQQPLHADWSHPADRARRQERDSDRRVRSPTARRREEHRRRGCGGGAARIPAHSHDLVRLHPRRSAARARDRRRRLGAQVDWDGRLLRHDRLDVSRGGVCSLVLCGHAVARGAQKGQAGARRRPPDC